MTAWTKTPPSEPGFYWCTIGTTPNHILELFWHKGELVAPCRDVDVHGNEILTIDPARLGYWWWPEPIEYPPVNPPQFSHEEWAQLRDGLQSRPSANDNAPDQAEA